MDDLVISAFSIYDFEKIKHWVNSLERTGYNGRKAMIVFNVLDDTIKKLQEHGFEIFLVANQRNKDNDGFHFMDNFGYQVPTLRHYFYWKFLKDLKDIRYVISTDVDIVFQSNPSEWLTKNMNDKKLNYGGEGLKYKDEPWGNENLHQAYGQYVYEEFKNNEIFNVGTFGGKSEYVKDMVFHIFTNGVNRPIPIVDQAVYNVLIQTQPYKDVVLFAPQYAGWAVQAGTTVDPSKIDMFRPVLTEAEPMFENGIVKTAHGQPFCIVHQYDRVPEWKKFVMNKYNQEDPNNLFTYRTI